MIEILIFFVERFLETRSDFSLSDLLEEARKLIKTSVHVVFLFFLNIETKR